MKKIFFWLEMIVGFIFFMGGILTYGLSKLNILNVQPVGFGVWGIVIVGIMLIVFATFDNFKKTREQKIEETDERNIAISHRAKANAFNVMTLLFAIALVVLDYTGRFDTVSFFVLLGVFAIVQIVFVVSLWYFQKKM
jgi:uncharacterized membrane protein